MVSVILQEVSSSMLASAVWHEEETAPTRKRFCRGRSDPANFLDEHKDITSNICPCREVFFEANGIPRVVEVVEKEQAGTMTSRRPARERGDPNMPGSVSAPMSGDVLDVKIKPGQRLASERGLPTLPGVHRMLCQVVSGCKFQAR